MRTRVRRWGNSLGIRIPRPFAEETGLAADAEVELTLADGALLIEPVPRPWTLAELLAAVTEGNRHGEFGTGPATGRESW
jgi:antitoxin MazE